jgi:hypothetical protein
MVGKDFLPAVAPHSPLSGRAISWGGPGEFCKSRNAATVPVICPTCQIVFARIAQGIHARDHHAALHGVVFDILVGSKSRVGLAAVFSR